MYLSIFSGSSWQDSGFKRNMFFLFVLSCAWDKEKILGPHEESNLRPSDSALWCSFKGLFTKLFGKNSGVAKFLVLLPFCYFRKDGASLYDVLGVDKSATQEEIKKAYRKVRLVNLSCDCNVGKWFKWKLKSIHDFFFSFKHSALIVLTSQYHFSFVKCIS